MQCRLKILTNTDYTVDPKSELKELEAKLKYYLTHAEKAEAIARRGYGHMRAHHTSSARGRQFLGWLGQAAGPTSTPS